jgi:hypothetical protein
VEQYTLMNKDAHGLRTELVLIRCLDPATSPVAVSPQPLSVQTPQGVSCDTRSHYEARSSRRIYIKIQVVWDDMLFQLLNSYGLLEGW